MSAFHVQGRRTRRDVSGGTRNDVRLADAEDRDEAGRLAEHLRRDGFTVWIWKRIGPTGPGDLELLETRGPNPSTLRRNP